MTNIPSISDYGISARGYADEMVVHLDGFIKEISGQTDIEKDAVRMNGRADGQKHTVIVEDIS